MQDFVSNQKNRDTATMPKLGQRKDRKVKEYNFKNPDKFSKDHLRMLSGVHEYFCRQASMALTAALRAQTEFTLSSVQQMTYGDYIAALPETTITAVMNMYPFVTEFSVGIDREAIGYLMDRLLGGTGEVSSDREELTDVEIGIAKDTLRKILFYLPESWQVLVPTATDIDLNALEMSPIAVQIVPPTEIVALINLDIKIASFEAKMRICLPYSAIEDIIGTLNRQTAYKNERVEESDDARETILSRLSATDLEVKIVLARGELFLSEIMNLQVGDVVKLSSKPSDKSEIWVADELKFTGHPGQLGRKYSVTIAEPFIAD